LEGSKSGLIGVIANNYNCPEQVDKSSSSYCSEVIFTLRFINLPIGNEPYFFHIFSSYGNFIHFLFLESNFPFFNILFHFFDLIGQKMTIKLSKIKRLFSKNERGMTIFDNLMLKNDISIFQKLTRKEF
jgi:hypothetical protein